MDNSAGISYEACLKELEALLEELEQQKITIDQLPDKVRRAYQLLEFCQKKLKLTEEELQQLTVRNF
ncbi:MAG: exodeoxyribonuclease VII small subunit [Flammeovirgaceae bacterium]|nr:exodeoxyribonuclease VII small subunit [Flammeovirgaceae bacterium]